jgi:DNA-binding transcriptional LysR family regulator
MNVSMRVLRTFLIAAEEGHFGKAAKRAHLSQPALSRQISNLEEEIGAALFARVGRGVELTSAGETFVEHARRCLRHYESGVLAAKRASSGLGGELRVGFVSPAIYANIVPRLISSFRDRAPGVSVSLDEFSSQPQARAIENGELDVAFLHPPIPGIELELHVLLRQRFVAALPAKHPLASKDALHARELASEPFIIFPRERGPGLYDRTITACQMAGFSPDIVQEATRMQTIISLVAAGIGVAILPHSVMNLSQEGTVYRELLDVEEEGLLAAAWSPENTNPTLAVFLEIVKTFDASRAL